PRAGHDVLALPGRGDRRGDQGRRRDPRPGRPGDQAGADPWPRHRVRGRSRGDRRGRLRRGGRVSVVGKLAGFAVVLALVFAGAAFAGSKLDVHAGKTATEEHGMGAMDAPQPVRGLAVSENGLTLELARRTAPQGSAFPLAFRIVDARGQTVRDFDVE